MGVSKVVLLRERLPADHAGYMRSLEDSAGSVVPREVRKSAVAVVDALVKYHPDSLAYTGMYFFGWGFHS